MCIRDSGEADTAFREAGYRLFGFFPLPEKPVRLPALLRQRALVNPDAGRNAYGIRVRDSTGRAFVAVPRIFSKVSAYAAGTKAYIDHVEMRLFECVETADSLLLLDQPRPGYPPAALLDWSEQIGPNTDYVLHPEEILAEHVAMLLLGEPGVDKRGKELLEGLRRVMSDE